MTVLSTLGMALAAAIATTSLVGPPSFDVSGQTFDGGGGTSTAGDFVLSGTIGQPDASDGSLVGAAFSLEGGFWPGSIGTSVSCPADFNGDGVVDASDLLALLAAWGPCASPCPPDTDGNGQVDSSDLLALLAGWGICDGSGL